MWTSSWFMSVFIRSLAAIVSKMNAMGAICTVTRSPGTVDAPAFPLSDRSTSSTSGSFFGSKPKMFFWNFSELSAVRVTCGRRNDSVPST